MSGWTVPNQFRYDNIVRKRAAFLQAMDEVPTMRQAANLAGISERTARRYRGMP